MAADSGPKSLYDLVYHHNGFLVNPLLWTSRHLDLVGCRFEDAITSLPCREPVQDDQKTEETHLKPQPHAEVLALKPHPVDKLRALFSILVGREHEFARYRRGYTFYFQGRPVHRPEYLVFHRHEQPPDRIYNNSPPVIGGARGRRFEACPGPGGIDNQIGINIRNIKISQTKPKEWTEDPYFLCHLLALAQFQGRKSQLPEPKSYIVKP
ncbi:hypothetical protein N7456_007588 [Penicillium angulare]|uniref:Uncharacterized protein n=1 Tax=Penicillium angulare TaxID=116970 RepID=A0A9W9FAY5_9EURO|nr:hypothetical protein N7456_007588 [Penicillium angulare]